jgi:hypothetical protein
LERAVEDLLLYGKEKKSRVYEEIEKLNFYFNFYLGDESGFYE